MVVEPLPGVQDPLRILQPAQYPVGDAEVVEPVGGRPLGDEDVRGGEFDVLAALRRAGEPYTLIPSELADTLMMTRAGMTGRIDRLERAGLVERRIDPADRRSFLVALTAEGLRAIDGVLADHADNLARITGVLDPETADGLDRALRLMLRGLEGSPGAG